METTLFTVGHGSRTLAEFEEILRAAGIRRLVDVRSVPGSRKFPHFGRESLEQALALDGVAYVWEGRDLGGFRKPLAGSPHTALRSEGFRSYADHMETAGFRAGAERLLAWGAEAPTAFLCAERLPWRCHRFLLSDYLTFRGARVVHLMGGGHSREHRLSPLAREEGERLVYDRESAGGQTSDRRLGDGETDR